MSTIAHGEYLRAEGNEGDTTDARPDYLWSADAVLYSPSSASAAVLGQPAATAEVEAVDAGAEVGAAGLHAVPREHAHAFLARALAHAPQRLDLAVGACRQGGSVAICKTSGRRSREECARVEIHSTALK